MTSIEELDTVSSEQLSTTLSRFGVVEFQIVSATGDEMHRYYKVLARFRRGIGLGYQALSAEAFYDESLPGRPITTNFMIEYPQRRYRKMLLIALPVFSVILALVYWLVEQP